MDKECNHVWEEMQPLAQRKEEMVEGKPTRIIIKVYYCINCEVMRAEREYQIKVNKKK